MRNRTPSKQPPSSATRWEVVPGVEPYAVYSPYGRILGRFGDRRAAVAAMWQWPQAVYVLFAGNEIIARKGEGFEDRDGGASLDRRAA